jgi:thioredoxin reductase (NADPH)
MEPASGRNVDVNVTGDSGDAALPPSVAARRAQIFPKLKPDEIDRLRRFGTLKRWKPGEFLFEAGTPGQGMFVLLRGRVLITRKDGLGGHTRVVEHGPGHFMAEVGSLSGRPPLVYGRAVGAVEAVLIDPPSLRAVLVAEAELGERIMRALILRRVALFESGTGGPVIIGTPGSARMVRLQGFLSRNTHPHTVLDAAHDREAEPAMRIHSPRPEELPLVICPDGSVLKRPTEQALARAIGLLPDLSADRVYDVAIVGAGPAGLAAAVYAGSDGLSVAVLEERVIGGQIGASARHRNSAPILLCRLLSRSSIAPAFRSSFMSRAEYAWRPGRRSSRPARNTGIPPLPTSPTTRAGACITGLRRSKRGSPAVKRWCWSAAAIPRDRPWPIWLDTQRTSICWSAAPA